MHYCQGLIQKHGQKFWGSPWDRPLNDPIPQELLEKHPDVLTDWANCDNCGTPMCGKPAQHRLRYEDEPDVWLCADHYDEFMEQDEYRRLPNWHELGDYFCNRGRL
jgi:hypothetical protein